MKIFMQKHNEYLPEVLNGHFVQSTMVVSVFMPHTGEGIGNQMDNGYTWGGGGEGCGKLSIYSFKLDG